MLDDPGAGPATPVQPLLTRRERRLVWLAALLPTPVVVLLTLLFTGAGGLGAADVVGAVVVYGGLSGLAAGVVTFERLLAGHCRLCGHPNARRAPTCTTCGYDLQGQPHFACEERHTVHLEPGVCACGLPLLPLPSPQGIGSGVRRMLWFALWLFVVLMGLGLLLPLIS